MQNVVGNDVAETRSCELTYGTTASMCARVIGEYRFSSVFASRAWISFAARVRELVIDYGEERVDHTQPSFSPSMLSTMRRSGP